ncbi:hypothetical protein CIW83_12555 [Tissierella sp. P1]|uniref:4'-phosphopantetheinyl transferase family protein n=1 Tax=unclassified Tissierella TaxID=2638726 RepID=UPI000BA14A3A|nr:4'-phosphopantetheinyl transferase family protein [Tissierella sp. P1]OZV11865.1 hypothetical protein CIW83_12555 [Tissierella sp. P1]
MSIRSLNIKVDSVIQRTDVYIQQLSECSSTICICSVDYPTARACNLSDLRKIEHEQGRRAAYLACENLIGRGGRDAHIDIKNGIFGEPVVISDNSIPLHVTISHSRAVGVAIDSKLDGFIGIDIESTNREHKRALEYISTEKERQFFIDQEMPTLICWTVKEALSKVLKTGFLTSTEIFDINKTKIENDMIVCEFRYFSQFEALSIWGGSLCLSMVFPKKRRPEVDATSIRKYLRSISILE